MNYMLIKVILKYIMTIFIWDKNTKDTLTWNHCNNMCLLSFTEAILHIYFLSYLLILEITSKEDV